MYILLNCWDPKVKNKTNKNTIYYDKTQHAIFWDKLFFQFVSHFIMLAVQIFCWTSESISKWEDLCHPYLMKFSVADAVNHPPPPPPPNRTTKTAHALVNKQQNQKHIYAVIWAVVRTYFLLSDKQSSSVYDQTLPSSIQVRTFTLKSVCGNSMINLEDLTEIVSKK